MTLLVEEIIIGDYEEQAEFFGAEPSSLSKKEVEADEDDEDDDEDEDDEDNDEHAEKNRDKNQSNLKSEHSPKGEKLKLILIGSGVLLMAAIMVGGYFYLYGNDSTQRDIVTENKPTPLKTPALYVDFPQEEILAILKDATGKTHHLVIRVVLLTRDPHVKEALMENSALIISEFLELLESQDYAYLLTYDGKVAIRKTLLKHLKKSIPKYGSNVEEVLLTKFIMD